MASHMNKNLDGLPLYHLRRIGKPASKDGVVSVMDFYRLTYMIGRSEVQVDFYIDSSSHMQSASLSRCHARVVRQHGNQHRLYDDSLNGVFVNNIKIAGSCLLNEGDKVIFGHPCGARIPVGSRSRQPDSDNQFMFEMCSCDRNNENKANDFNKAANGFKKPISPAESNCIKHSSRSKRAARKSTQSFSPDDVRRLKKAWEDRQGGSSASETSDAEESNDASSEQSDMETETDKVKAEHSVEYAAAVKVDIVKESAKFDKCKNDIANTRGLENGSVYNEKGTNDLETEECEQVPADVIACNQNMENGERVEETECNMDETESKEGQMNDTSTLSGSNDENNESCVSDGREDLAVLEGTFNSIMEDLYALRGKVENDVKSASCAPQVPVVATKSPTKDASIQTSHNEVKEHVDMCCGNDTSVSPTKEMAIQTSQALFFDPVGRTLNVHESMDEFLTHSDDDQTLKISDIMQETDCVDNYRHNEFAVTSVNGEEVDSTTNKETDSVSSDEYVITPSDSLIKSSEQTLVVENGVVDQSDQSVERHEETLITSIAGEETNEVVAPAIKNQNTEMQVKHSSQEIQEMEFEQNLDHKNDDTTETFFDVDESRKPNCEDINNQEMEDDKNRACENNSSLEKTTECLESELIQKTALVKDIVCEEPGEESGKEESSGIMNEYIEGEYVKNVIPTDHGKQNSEVAGMQNLDHSDSIDYDDDEGSVLGIIPSNSIEFSDDDSDWGVGDDDVDSDCEKKPNGVNIECLGSELIQKTELVKDSIHEEPDKEGGNCQNTGVMIECTEDEYVHVLPTDHEKENPDVKGRPNELHAIKQNLILSESIKYDEEETGSVQGIIPSNSIEFSDDESDWGVGDDDVDSDCEKKPDGVNTECLGSELIQKTALVKDSIHEEPDKEGGNCQNSGVMIECTEDEYVHVLPTDHEKENPDVNGRPNELHAIKQNLILPDSIKYDDEEKGSVQGIIPSNSIEFSDDDSDWGVGDDDVDSDCEKKPDGVNTECLESELIQKTALVKDTIHEEPGKEGVMIECTEDKYVHVLPTDHEKENPDVKGRPNELHAIQQNLILSDSIEYDNEEGSVQGIIPSNSIEFSDDESDLGVVGDDIDSDHEDKPDKVNHNEEVVDDLSEPEIQTIQICSDKEDQVFEERICISSEVENFISINTENENTETEKSVVDNVNSGKENEQEIHLNDCDTGRKRKVSDEFCVDTETENPRRRCCSDDVNVVTSKKNIDKVVEAEDTNIEGEDQSVQDAANKLNGDNDCKKMDTEVDALSNQGSDVEEKGLSASQGRLQKLKKGMKRFFSFWSKKTYEMREASSAGYICVQDTAGHYKLLDIKCPDMHLKSGNIRSSAGNGSVGNNAPAEKDDRACVVSKQNKMCTEPGQNAVDISKVESSDKLEEKCVVNESSLSEDIDVTLCNAVAVDDSAIENTEGEIKKVSEELVDKCMEENTEEEITKVSEQLVDKCMEEKNEEEITKVSEEIVDKCMKENTEEEITKVSEEFVDQCLEENTEEEITKVSEELVDECMEENTEEEITKVSEECEDKCMEEHTEEEITKVPEELVDECMEENTEEEITKVSEELVDECMEENTEEETSKVSEERVDKCMEEISEIKDATSASKDLEDMSYETVEDISTAYTSEVQKINLEQETADTRICQANCNDGCANVMEPERVETSICQTDSEIDSHDMINLSVLESAFKTPSKVKNVILNEGQISPTPQPCGSSQGVNASQSQSPIIAKMDIAIDNNTSAITRTNRVQLFDNEKVDKEVASQLSCRFSDDDEDGFVSPEIDFSHLDDSWDEIVEDSENDLNDNDVDMFENDTVRCDTETIIDQDKEPENLDESEFQEKVSSVTTENLENEMEYTDDNNDDPLENYMNHETEVESENNDKEKHEEAGASVDLDFDFCDSESEKETADIEKQGEIEVISDDDNQEDDINDNQDTENKSNKRKSESGDDQIPKRKRDQTELDNQSGSSTPQKDAVLAVVPFKTPLSVQRMRPGKSTGSYKQTHSPISSTQLIDNSQAIDLDSLTATQVSTVSEQLSDKARDPARSKASRTKAKDLLEKLRAKRRIKEEALEDEPTPGPSDDTSGSEEIIYSRKERREKSQALVVLEDVDKHVNSCRIVINKMKSMFADCVSLHGNPRVEAWRRELTCVEKKLEFPKTVIAVVGDTGSGKSSLMNAILDHRSVLPTSGIRACTAVVVEVVSNSTSPNFEADIEFLQRKEWMEELQVLLKDLTGLDGTVKNRQPDPTSDAFVSYCKVKAVYGRIDRFEVLSRHTTVTHWLGRVKVVKSKNPEDFRRQVEKYIETQEPGSGGQYWPIVKHVRLRMPNCNVCSSGAALVDLPGVRDSNAARDKIAREYMKNCTAVWVVSSIHRAIDDKTAKELLGENFRRQLLMDGQYGSIAFICTKSDVIVPSEIIRPLDLEGRTKQHEDLITEMEAERSELDLTVSSNTAEIRKLTKKVPKLKTEAQELRDNLGELTNLLDPTDLDSSQSEAREAIQEYEQELNEKENELKGAETRIEQLQDQKQDASQRTLELEKKLNIHRKTIAAICARARNEYASKEIRRDFKAGLKEMKRRAGMLNDDDDEEDDIYSDDEDDDDDVGSSAENLKVFCCSSTEYQKMKKLLTDDGPPQVFSSLEDTQIPALRHYVHEMTSIRRKQWLERLIQGVGRFVFDMHMYVSEGGDMKSRDRMFARSTIDIELQRFDATLAPVLHQLGNDIDGVFDGSIRQKMEEGSANATKEANATCAKWSAPFVRDKTKEKRSGGLHWQTYRATVRRQGVYSSKSYGPVDFNEDLAEPVYRSMTIVWDRAFSGMLWKILEKLKSQILDKLKTFTSGLAPRLEQLGIQVNQTMRVSSLLQSSAANKLTEMVAHLKDIVTNKQRDISRIITPHVQSSLLPEYELCGEESGTGMFMRIKSYMSRGIDRKRFTMFDEATQQLMQHLIDLQTEIVQNVSQVCQSLIQDLRTAFEPLWEAPSNTWVIRSAFQHSVNEVCDSMQQIYKEAGIPHPEDRALVPVCTAYSGAGAPACSLGSNQVMNEDGDTKGWQSYERTFQKKQDTSYGTMEQCGQMGVRVKTERLSQSSVAETVETVSRVHTLHVKQEKPEGNYNAGIPSTASLTGHSSMDFGHQTLQDLKTGKLEVSPVEVTIATTPRPVVNAQAPRVIVVPKRAHTGSVGQAHPRSIVTPASSGNVHYIVTPGSIRPSVSNPPVGSQQFKYTSSQPGQTTPLGSQQFKYTSSQPGQTVVRPVYMPSLVSGQKEAIKNANILVPGISGPSVQGSSAYVPVTNAMPGPSHLLHTANRTTGSRIPTPNKPVATATATVSCRGVETSSSSQIRPVPAPTLKLVVGKENISSNGSSSGLVSATQPCGNNSSHAKGKRNLSRRGARLTQSQTAVGRSTPPPVVIKTEPAERGVYGRKFKYLGTIDLTDD